MTALSTERTGSRPTMAEVAAEAHVSVKTVSRVLNHEPGVRDQTAERVRAVVERLGFRRTNGALALRGRTSTIGLVVEDIANPFYSQIHAAVEREARSRQYLLITTSAEGSPARERALLAALVNRRVDGLVVVPAADGPGSHAAIEPGSVPVVYVDRPVRDTAHDVVVSDNAGGIRGALEHLVAYGHQRIGFLGDDPGFWTARQRRDAFTATHADLGLPGPVRVGMGPHDVGSVTATLGRWLAAPDPVSAVITGNNRVTVAVLRAIRALGGELPVIGFDDFELADLIDPPVTVVSQDPAGMGQKAAQQLFARLLGDESPPATIVTPTRLIVRGTPRPTAPPASPPGTRRR